MTSRMVDGLKRVLKGATIVGLCFLITKAATGSAARLAVPDAAVKQAPVQGMRHDRRHMHMRNWALEPTGRPGVSPLVM